MEKGVEAHICVKEDKANVVTKVAIHQLRVKL